MKSLTKKLVGVSLFSVVLVLLLAPGVFAQPDLGITGLQASPTIVYPGEDVNVNIQVTNVGTSTASGANISAVVKHSGTVVTSKDFIGYALDPSESQQFTFSWIPYNIGTYTIEVNVSAPDDVNPDNDYAETSITSTTDPGAVLISNFYATETIFANPSGCLMQPLVISGFVKENGIGTNDRVYMSIDDQLVSYVHANPSNEGYFRESLSGLCFEEDGTYNVRADVDRGSGVIATANQDVEILFSSDDGGVGPGDGFYSVDIEVTPYNLNVRTGDTAKYLLRMRNIGDEEDTYFIEIETHDSMVDRWVSSTVNQLTLKPGEVKYAYLVVELPENAQLGKYPINVRINGIARDVDRVYLNVLKGDNYEEGGTGKDYEVFLDATPYSLDIEAGQSGVYTLTIRNMGNLADEYEIRTSVSSVIHNWIDLEYNSVVVNPGQSRYVDLFVHIPKDVEPQSHSITVRAAGTRTDMARINFNVKSPEKTYDVDVKRPRITPEQVWSDTPKNIEISVPVSFRDLRTAEGQFVTTKLYINGITMDAKTTYIASGHTNTVSFYTNTRDYPIENKEGEHEFYVIAQADYEKAKSAISTLSVVEPGIVDINITESEEPIETPVNGSFEFTLRITNRDHTDNIYLINMYGLDTLEYEPDSVKVDSGMTETIKVKGTIGDEPEGEHPVNVRVRDKFDSSDSAEKTLTLDVSEKYATGVGIDPDGVTGYLLLTNSGRGLLIGLVILAVIAGLYYNNYKKPPEGKKGPSFLKSLLNPKIKKEETEKGTEEKEKENGKEESDMNEEEKKQNELEEKQVQQKNTSVQSARVLEEKKPPEKESEDKEEEIPVWEGEGISLDNVNILNQPISKEGSWNPKDSETVLLSLDDIKNEFHEDINHVKNLKRSMGDIVNNPRAQTSEKSVSDAFKNEVKSLKPDSKQNQNIGRKAKSSKSVQDAYIEKIVKDLK